MAWATTAVLACLALVLRDVAPAAIHAPDEPVATQPEPAPVAPVTRPPLWAQTGRDGSRPSPAE
jgi:hypothetical protein